MPASDWVNGVPVAPGPTLAVEMDGGTGGIAKVKSPTAGSVVTALAGALVEPVVPFVPKSQLMPIPLSVALLPSMTLVRFFPKPGPYLVVPTCD